MESSSTDKGKKPLQGILKPSRDEADRPPVAATDSIMDKMLRRKTNLMIHKGGDRLLAENAFKDRFRGLGKSDRKKRFKM